MTLFRYFEYSFLPFHGFEEIDFYGKRLHHLKKKKSGANFNFFRSEPIESKSREKEGEAIWKKWTKPQEL